MSKKKKRKKKYDQEDHIGNPDADWAWKIDDEEEHWSDSVDLTPDTECLAFDPDKGWVQITIKESEEIYKKQYPDWPGWNFEGDDSHDK